MRFAENKLAIFKETIKVLINPALTEESMSRAPVHKWASIVKFPLASEGLDSQRSEAVIDMRFVNCDLKAQLQESLAKRVLTDCGLGQY